MQVQLRSRITYSGALWNIYNTFGYSFPDETLLTSHTAVPTQIQCSTNTNDTTALLPAITSRYQPLSPIAYDGGRPGPPWPLPTKSLHVYIPTASTDTSTGLQWHSTDTSPGIAWQFTIHNPDQLARSGPNSTPMISDRTILGDWGPNLK